jgi:2-polyprenyl-3-methyl-5-hydroxy-6-metoxy-1,4-benzoquinol methylase
MKLDDDEIARQWDAVAEEWARQQRADMDLYRRWVNDPCMIEMLGDVSGLRVLDAACGEGYFARTLARLGAHVTGVDLSREMIRLALAEEEREPLGVEYHWGNLGDMGFAPDESFPVVVAAMSMMDVVDLDAACREIARVMCAGGRFVFSILHPCFATPPVVGWVFEQPGDLSNVNRLYYKVDEYFRRSARKMLWRIVGGDRDLPSPTTDIHRTLGDYAAALSGAGLWIARLEEPQPQPELIERDPTFLKNMRIPYFLHVAARKPDAAGAAA